MTFVLKTQSMFLKIFSVFSHHCNYTVIETVKNLLHKAHRDISLNAKFVVIFKNTRYESQIQYFVRQAFPDCFKGVMKAYKSATSPPRGYILLDFRPETDDQFRARSNIFPGETNLVFQ